MRYMKKNFFIPVLIAVFTTVILLSCKTEIPSDLAKENIIPKAVSVTSTGDYFTLNEKSDIYVEGGSEELKQIGQYLAVKLEPLTGFEAEVKSTSGEPWSRNIFLKLSDLDSIFGQEGYKLTITKKSVKLTAGNPAGLFRGIQTILQFLLADKGQ